MITTATDPRNLAALEAELATLRHEVSQLRAQLAQFDHLDLIAEPDSLALTLNNANFRWDTQAGTLTFFGLPAVLFWIDPSLRRMLEPLATEVGIPLFRLLVAHEASHGTEEDYHAMVTMLGTNFREGFLAWGRAVGTAGWGQFQLPVYDPENQCAEVVINNAWELQMQQTSETKWGCPFLQGKLIGIFSHALQTPCWADEEIITAPDTNGTPAVRFRIYASPRTIVNELDQIRQEHRRAREAQRVREALLLELSTPLIPIAAGVLVMPLVGTIDSTRAQLIMEQLLTGVSQHRANVVILDVTGVRMVDTQVANAFLQAAQAVRLLGARVMLTGIQPQIAQTLVHLGVNLSAIETRSTLQDAIHAALGNSPAHG